MSPGNELEELSARASGVVTALITASTQLALALIELRIQQLRKAAQRDQELARQARDRTRLHHQADAATWRAAMRPQWWRRAGAEDISRVWRAASTWQHVDPRAAEARQVVIERLAERGVQVDPAAPGEPSPDDVAWLSDALDQAAADRAARAVAEASEERSERNADDQREAPTVIDGEASESRSTRLRQPTAREREQRAAGHVRAAWSAERAERVLACKAWPALAHQLGQLEEQGHDVEVLLHGVPAFVDRAHTPAAFAFRSIEDRLDGLVDLGTQRGTAGQPTQSGERSATEAASSARGPASTPAQTAGKRLVGDATAEQVRAAGTAYWGQRHLQARAIAAANPSQERDDRGHTAEDRVLFALNQMNAYAGDDMSPHARLSREEPADQQGIVAQLRATREPAPTAAPATAVDRGGERSSAVAEPTGGGVETAEAGAQKVAVAEIDDPFGPEIAIDYEGRGREIAGRATPEHVRALGLRFWENDLANVSSRHKDAYQQRAATSYARLQIKQWTESHSPMATLGGEEERAASWIQAQLHVAAAQEDRGRAQRGQGEGNQQTARLGAARQIPATTVAAAEHNVAQAAAQSTAGSPVTTSAAQSQPPSGAAAAETETGRGQAAQLAAQAYPVPTKEAVVGAVDRADAGGTTASAAAVAAQPRQKESPSR